MIEKTIYQLRQARYEDARFLAHVSGLAMRPVEMRRSSFKEGSEEGPKPEPASTDDIAEEPEEKTGEGEMEQKENNLEAQ